MNSSSLILDLKVSYSVSHSDNSLLHGGKGEKAKRGNWTSLAIFLLDQVKGWKKRYWELNEQCNIQVPSSCTAVVDHAHHPFQIHGSATDQDLCMLKCPVYWGGNISWVNLYPNVNFVCTCILPPPGFF